MKSIQYFLNKNDKELELILSRLNQKEKYKLTEELLNSFENNISSELFYEYMKILSKIEITEEESAKLFKNKLASNNLLSFYLTISKLFDSHEFFFVKYAKYIDISSENFVKLLTNDNHRILLQHQVNRQLLNKRFTEEQKKRNFK